MAKFSDWYENQIINHMLRNQEFTPPANIYVALFLSVDGLEEDDPTDEVSGGAYVRRAVTLKEALDGSSENTNEIIFPEASENWGVVSHVALVDHLSNTDWGVDVHVLMWGSFPTPKNVETGDTLKINIGDLDVVVA